MTGSSGHRHAGAGGGVQGPAPHGPGNRRVAEWSQRVSFDIAQKIADAVLFEGYLLYPYRASSQKNQIRWQFGVLMPPAYPDEASSSQTECLLEPGSDPQLGIRLRFLQVSPRDGVDEGAVRE